MNGKQIVVATAALVLAAASVSAQAAPQRPPAMKHDLQCVTCHSGAKANVPAMPADHSGRENATCALCHAPDSPMQTAAPKTIPHQLAGKEACLRCHAADAEDMPAIPASHQGIDVKNCVLCHQPKS